MSETDGGSKTATKAGTAASLVPKDDAPHILVIDDDRRIRELLRSYLSDQGFRVSSAANAETAAKKLSGLQFELLVLDVMMPGKSGIEFSAELRQSSNIPILLLTARAEAEHRVAGLETGADDYLTKPFEPRELLLRINNILKRQARNAPVPTEITLGECSFNIERAELLRAGTPVRLTTREKSLLRIFALNRGKTISRAELAESERPTSARAIDVQINRLRHKIEPEPSAPVYLQTVRGAGYILYTD